MEPRAYSDSSKSALILIDVINDLEFTGGKELSQYARPMAFRINELRSRADASDVPVIYVNDNFGRWQSDFKAQVAYCLRPGSKGREVTELLQPMDEDYFVLKPKHSGFFSTTLDVLLIHLGCRRLVLTGMATNICVLFTANDGYMRDYEIVVPQDCCASAHIEDHQYAIRQMESTLKADVRESWEVSFQ